MCLQQERMKPRALIPVFLFAIHCLAAAMALPGNLQFQERMPVAEYKQKRQELIARHLPALQQMAKENHPSMGVLVFHAVENSDAEKLGIIYPCIITSLNGVNPFQVADAFELDKNNQRLVEYYDPGEKKTKSAMTKGVLLGVNYENWRNVPLQYMYSRRDAGLGEDDLLCALLALDVDVKLAETALFHVAPALKDSHKSFVKRCEPWILHANSRFRELYEWLDGDFLGSAGQPQGLESREYARFCLAVNRFDLIQKAIRTEFIASYPTAWLMHVCENLSGGKTSGMPDTKAVSSYKPINKKPLANPILQEQNAFTFIDRTNLLEEDGLRDASPWVKAAKEKKTLVVRALRAYQDMLGFEVPFPVSSFRVSFDLSINPEQLKQPGSAYIRIVFSLLTPMRDKSRAADYDHRSMFHLYIRLLDDGRCGAGFGLLSSNPAPINMQAGDLAHALSSGKKVHFECVAHQGLVEVYANKVRLLQTSLNREKFGKKEDSIGLGLHFLVEESTFNVDNLLIEELVPNPAKK